MPPGVYERKTRPLAERFWEKVHKTSPDGCWLWTGSLVDGYGSIGLGRRSDGTNKAHIVAYEWERGPVPGHLELDHLCRNRACVNPAHLEAVTRRVNQVRGDGPSGRNSRKTHCPNGHPLSGPNLSIEPKKGGGSTRRCRTCRAGRGRRKRSPDLPEMPNR